MDSLITLESSLISVMDASNDAMSIIDANNGGFVAINDAHTRLFGFSLSELNQISLQDFYNIGNIKTTLKQFREASSFEILLCQARDKQGELLDIEFTCAPLSILGNDYFLLVNKTQPDQVNSPMASNTLSVERAFKDSEAKWQSITENSPDHIMLLDPLGKIIFINHTVSNLSVDEVLGRSVFEFVKPDQISVLKENYQSVLKTAQPRQFEIDYDIGDDKVYFENRVGPVMRDRKVIALIISSRDVTIRRKALQQLEKSQRQLRHALQAGRTGTWEWDIKTNEVIWSDGVEAMFGLADGSFQNSYDAFKALIHPEDRFMIESAIENTLVNNAKYYVEHRCIFPDKTIHWLSEQGEVYRDNEGKPIRMIGTVTDITERKNTELALNKYQQKLSLHFKHTPLGIIDWNNDLEVTEWNPAAEKIFGFSRNEALGKNAIGFIVPDSAKEITTNVWKSLIERRGGTRSTNENMTKDGSTITCEWYNTVLVDNDGNIIGVSSLVQNITDRILAEKELEKHRLHLEELIEEGTREIRDQARILDQIHDSVIATNLDGVIESWNYGATKLFGYTSDEAIGKHISYVYPNDQHEFLQEQVINPLLQKGEHEVEATMQKKEGETFDAQLSLSMRYDDNGEPSGMIGYSIDITARKLAEAKVLSQQHALQAANKELEAFSYSVSHDLRAPLRSIDGFTAAVFEDYYELLDDEGKRNLQRIRQNAQRMSSLIDDLLQLSRVSRHIIQKETVDLGLLATDVIQKYKYESPDRKITFEVENDMKVEGDPGLLRIALDNLISNSWKYTVNNPVAKIHFEKNMANGTQTFCISDNGVGFDMNYVDKLFGPFQRLHGSEEFSGNGIGLATVSRIIARHGGKIWAEAEIDKGAKFYFTI